MLRAIAGMKPIDCKAMVVGVSGIMGSGKTTVAGVFERLGASRIDADTIGKSLLVLPEVRKELIKSFGYSIVDDRGRIDIRSLAKVAFRDRRATARLNSITHPRLIKMLTVEVRKASGRSPIVVVDAALLPEWRMDSLLDILIVVDTSVEEAIRRSCKHRGFQRKEVIARMQSQLSRKQKIRRADIIVPNYGTLNDLRLRAERIFLCLAEVWGGDKNALQRKRSSG